MQKIKIAYIIDTIESPTCGTEKQLLLLIRNLDRNMFEPYLCCLKSSEWLEKEFDLCPLHIVGIRSFKRLISYFRILNFSNFLKRGKFHIAQTYFKDANIVGIISARLAGIRTVISSRRGLPYWNNKFELQMLKILNMWVTFFIANSKSTKRLVCRAEGIPKNKIHIIYNGIDLKPFKRTSVKIKGRYRMPDSPLAIGIVANPRPVKRIDVFLKAAQLVKKKLSAVEFLVIGDGPALNTLKKLSNDIGLDNNVKFLGKKRDIISILNTLDIGVLSSHFESFSNSVIEYLAAGLPVVCTDIDGLKELIEDGVNGFLVPNGDYQAMADAILKILMNRDLASDMCRRNREKVKELFSLDIFLNTYKNFYSNVVYG